MALFLAALCTAAAAATTAVQPPRAPPVGPHPGRAVPGAAAAAWLHGDAARPRYDDRGAFDKFWGETTPLLYRGAPRWGDLKAAEPFRRRLAYFV
jgi:hypothetical protein